jgi:hypothetical protein
MYVTPLGDARDLMSKRNKSQNIYMEGALELFYLIVSLSNNVRFSVPWVLGTTILSVK